ncbi:MAG: hypothetical protein GAK43_02671 [Stenotrophomonas maltophilia]|nr:MAG: hypothetical protein GAK43_02671 [Stenotrophomonas maltophilia]
MTHAPHDLLDQLAGIAPDSPLAQARAKRSEARKHTQLSYEALFEVPADSQPTLAERLELARQSALLHEDSRLAEHYAQRLQALGGVTQTPRLEAARHHARALAVSPLRTQAEDLAQLLEAGWTVTAIVTLSQIVAFVSYQSRLLSGYRLLLGDSGAAATGTALAGDWHQHAITRSGHRAPTHFTQQALEWEAWLPALTIEELAEPIRQELSAWQLLDHPYFRLLARDFPILLHRRLADLDIFFGRGGLPRAERELAAAVTSKVNGCIFCASVHASRASQLSRRQEDVQRLLDTAAGHDLSSGQEPLWAAQVDFAASLATTPAVVTHAQLQTLRDQGLDTLQLLDLVQAVAFFSWANRLMLSLGEPWWPDN